MEGEFEGIWNEQSWCKPDTCMRLQRKITKLLSAQPTSLQRLEWSTTSVKLTASLTCSVVFILIRIYCSHSLLLTDLTADLRNISSPAVHSRLKLKNLVEGKLYQKCSITLMSYSKSVTNNTELSANASVQL